MDSQEIILLCVICFLMYAVCDFIKGSLSKSDPTKAATHPSSRQATFQATQTATTTDNPDKVAFVVSQLKKVSMMTVSDIRGIVMFLFERFEKAKTRDDVKQDIFIFANVYDDQDRNKPPTKMIGKIARVVKGNSKGAEYCVWLQDKTIAIVKMEDILCWVEAQ